VSAGIYVHLPYCASRCGYCAFVVSTDPSSKSDYLDALSREIALVASEARRELFDTVYLGGGTPSLLDAADVGELLDRIRSGFSVSGDAEVTIEANPEDVTVLKRDAWRAAGVTRVSVGVQSFSDRELAAVGRRHDAGRAAEALEILADTDLSLSGDLILGLPEQTAASFCGSLESLVRQGVDHVSVYLLETDKSKAMEEDRRRRPGRYLDDDAQAAVWLEAAEILADLGFEHYEISNWARPGRRSRHNVKYWEREPTLGLGVSAHEFFGGRRRANASVIATYLECLSAGRRATALDRPVAADEEASERIVLGLRLSTGVERGRVESWIAAHGDPNLADDWASFREEGWISESNGRVALTERGFLVSNEILCRFA
jgi:oxygen-independent coproporphyrinogen-3 oxidase